MSKTTFTKLTKFVNEFLSHHVGEDELPVVMTAWNARKNNVLSLLDAESSVKSVKDPNAPTKWRNSYMCFYGDKRPDLKKANPDMTSTQLATEIGRLWKALPEKQKQHYVSASATEKKAYEEAMKHYTRPESLGPLVKKRRAKAEPSAVKRGKSAYLFYSMDARATLTKNHPEIKGNDVFQRIGEDWKKLSEADRAKYVALAEADKLRYASEKESGSVQATSSVPATSSAPAKASTPAKSSAPAKSSTPAKSSVPATSSAPAKSSTPAKSSAPAKSSTPATPSPPVKRGRKAVVPVPESDSDENLVRSDSDSEDEPTPAKKRVSKKN